MEKLTLAPGVLAGRAVNLFTYRTQADCALPSVNVIGSNSAKSIHRQTFPSWVGWERRRSDLEIRMPGKRKPITGR
jgi:hypothetical protein